MESIAHLIGARKLATKIRRNTRAVGVFAYRPAIVFSRGRIVISRPDITNSSQAQAAPSGTSGIGSPTTIRSGRPLWTSKMTG